MAQPDLAVFPSDTGPDQRQLPYDEDAEQALLGAILIDNEVLHRVGDLLAEDRFHIPVHGRIFAAAQRLVDKAQVANPVTLKAYFEGDEALSEVGGGGYLARLATRAATVIDAVGYARLIREHHLRRQLIAIGEDVVNDAFRHELDRDATAQIEAAEKALFDLAEGGESGFRDLASVAAQALQTMEAAWKREGGIAGLSTGLADLDERLGGLVRGDLVVLAARPGMGKTALATNIAFTAAQRYRAGVDEAGRASVEDGAVVGFFSLEMAGEQLVARLLAERSGIPAHRLRSGSVDARDFEAVVAASTEIASLPLYIDDTPALSIAGLRSRARRLKRTQGLSLLVVDYLQLVRPTAPHREGNRVQEVSEVTQGLKALAKELDLPVLAVSQLSRAVESREDKRPLLSDLRESGSIEQDADIVMFLYREEYYLARQEPQPKSGEDEYGDAFRQRIENWQQRMEKKKGITEVIVAKHRHGPVGEADIYFDAATTRYSDLETRHSPDDVPF